MPDRDAAIQEDTLEPLTKTKPFKAGYLVFLALVWFILFVPAVTDTGYHGLQFFFLVAPLSAAYLLTWIWAFASNVNSRSMRNRREWKYWYFCTLLILIGGLLACPKIGFPARFYLSSTALERYAESLPRDAWSREDRGRVGLFRIEGYRTSEDGAVAIFTSTSGIMDSAGLLYLPPGTTIPEGSIEIREHLFGPWYRFEEEF